MFSKSLPYLTSIGLFFGSLNAANADDHGQTMTFAQWRTAHPKATWRDYAKNRIITVAQAFKDNNMAAAIGNSLAETDATIKNNQIEASAKAFNRLVELSEPGADSLDVGEMFATFDTMRQKRLAQVRLNQPDVAANYTIQRGNALLVNFNEAYAALCQTTEGSYLFLGAPVEPQAKKPTSSVSHGRHNQRHFAHSKR
jgi:hypothetical protein